MNRRTKLVLVLLLLLGLLLACDWANWDWGKSGVVQSSVNHSAQPRPNRLGLKVEDAGGYSVNHFKIQVTVPGPPYPSHVLVKWTASESNCVTGVRASHMEYIHSSGDNMFAWKLPVDPNTGQTPQVDLRYGEYGAVDKVKVDTFEAHAEGYVSDNRTYGRARPLSGNAQATAPSVEAQPAQPPAFPDDTYYLWQVWLHWWPTEAVSMTASTCQEQMSLLQDPHTFFAVRFPVISPTLPYTAPYTLPLVTGPITYTPRLTLRYASTPYTSLITVPLELRPEYLGFLENRMPEAAGEHWLAMGAVTTPTVDCSSVPTMTNWMVEAEIWLDMGGTADAGVGQSLPLYACYEGQTSPTSLRALLSQDWGITCVGPQPVSLEEGPRIELAGTHTAWITPTQTITFYHYLRNWTGTGVTRTVAVSHTSTPSLPWRLYTAFESAPTTLVPITDTVEVPASFFKIRPLWAIVTVPENTPAGAATLVITATDVASPTLSTWTSDLLWVGEWVAPPPPPWERYKVYLPLVIRNR